MLLILLGKTATPVAVPAVPPTTLPAVVMPLDDPVG